MGLLLVLLQRSLAVLTLLACISWAQPSNPAGPTRDPRALDVLLQDYAYRAFVRPRTGIPYNGTVPSNLTGIGISALRLRTGSLFRKGVNYSEFRIPPGISATPFVERLVLVYQNLGNWSETFYPLEGYDYLTPVLGLLAYDARNLSAKKLKNLGLEFVRGEIESISIAFEDVKPAPPGSTPQCVSFSFDGGAPSFSRVNDSRVCSASGQGHFSIVAPAVSPAPSPAPATHPRGKKKKEERDWGRVLIIVGSVVGGLVLVAVMAGLVVWGRRMRERKRMRKMEKAAEAGEALQMTPVGETRAPAAAVTRTQPVLESEYVP